MTTDVMTDEQKTIYKDYRAAKRHLKQGRDFADWMKIARGYDQARREATRRPFRLRCRDVELHHASLAERAGLERKRWQGSTKQQRSDVRSSGPSTVGDTRKRSGRAV